VPHRQAAVSTTLPHVAGVWHGPLSARLEADELLDRPERHAADLDANLRDIRRVNLLAGGTRTTMLHLRRIVEMVPSDRPVTILDLATGSADIPVAVARWASRRGRPVSIIASDLSEEILALARHRVSPYRDIALVRYDARDVPLPDRSIDLVLCALALHHFAPPEATAVLREMDRLARYGFILNDIRRGRLGLAAAWISSRLATRNRLTLHDMPLSVRRAYTPSELRSLVADAGIDGATVTTHPLFRMAAVRGPAGNGSPA